jgi:Ca2+-binding RTX toxin-like protein
MTCESYGELYGEAFLKELKASFLGGDGGATSANALTAGLDAQAYFAARLSAAVAQKVVAQVNACMAAFGAAASALLNSKPESGEYRTATIASALGGALDVATPVIAELILGAGISEAAIPAALIAMVGFVAGAALAAAISARDDATKEYNLEPCHQKRTPPVKGAPNFNDPLVLDLSGSGIALTSLSGSSAYFDFTKSGYAQNTGWITSGEGLLVIAPSDGSTVTADDLVGADSGSGFSDLSLLDANADGIIDASDPGFSSLRVWIDRDGDGASTSGELYSLSDLGITSIGLSSTISGQTANGNIISAVSSFTITDSATGVTKSNTIAEVNFQTDRQNTKIPSTGSTEITSLALVLPNLDGYGALPDLQVTMSLDSDLAQAVKELVLNSSAMSSQELRTAFEAIIYKWAGASNVDPASDGEYVDARHVAVIYAFLGIDANSDAYYQQQPNWHNGPTVWEPYYSRLIDALEIRFISQIASSQFALGMSSNDVVANPYSAFSLVGFASNTDDLEGDPNTVIASVALAAPTDATAATAYWAQVLPILEVYANALGSELGTSQSSQFVSYAANTGVPTSALLQLASDLGISATDEGNTTGTIALTGPSFGGQQNFVAVGSGDKTLTGGWNTTYIYDSTGGNVTISTQFSGSYLTLAGILDTDVEYIRSVGSDDLAIKIISTDKTITLTGFFALGSWQGISSATYQISAKDVSQALLSETVSYLNSTTDSLSDQVASLAEFGYVVDNSFTAPELHRSAGATVYEIGVASNRHDIIDCTGDGLDSNVVRFGLGIVQADLHVTQSADGNDLIIAIGSSGQTLTLKGQGIATNGSIRLVSFSDGSQITDKELWDISVAEAASANSVAIYGWRDDNNLAGGTGDVSLVGRSGGGTFTTGTGDNYIESVDRDNTYVITPGSGNTVIMSDGTSGIGANVLKLPDDISSTDITISQASNFQDLIITLPSGQTITLDRGLSGMFISDSATIGDFIPVDEMQFSDGTIWNWEDLIDKSIATMEARGNDTVFAGQSYGDTALHAGAGTVTLDASLLASAAPLTLTAGTGPDTLIGGFADTTYVVGADATDVTIEKESWRQTAHAGIGENNVLAFGEGVSASDITVSIDSGGTQVILTNNSTGAVVRLVGQLSGAAHDTVEKVTFADGTAWTAQQLTEMANASSSTGNIYGSSGDDVLTAADTAVTLHGEAGNDTLIAGTGATLMIGGAGNDTYSVSRGDGPATISENADSPWYYSYADQNTLLLGAGISAADLLIEQSADGKNVVITIRGTNQTITLLNQISGSNPGDFINTVQFADGTTWSSEQLLEQSIATMAAEGGPIIYGDSYSNTIAAGDGDKTINSGGGYNDTVIAGAGDQTIDFGYGTNSLTLSTGDYHYTVTGGSGETVLHLAAGITASDLVATEVNDGQDLLIRIPSVGEEISLVGQLAGEGTVVARIQFADGSSMTSDDLTAQAIATEEASQSPIVYGDGGDNVLTGGSTDQTLIGGRGWNTLIAGSGNDTLIGAEQYSFNDQDTYIVNAGSGNTVIVENGGVNYPNWDKLHFGPGVSPADIAATQSADGQSIVLTNAVTGKSVTIEEIFENPRLQVVFDDGTSWNPEDLWQHSADGALANDAAVIYGDSGSNVLQAGDYDVTLVGNGGQDTYVSGSGDATFVGTFAYETYDVNQGAGTITVQNAPYGGYNATLAFGDGIDAADVVVTQSSDGRDVILSDDALGISVVLQDQIASADRSNSGGGGGPSVVSAMADFGEDSSPLSQTTEVTFADGTVWTAEDVLDRSVAQAITDDNTTIYGDRNANTLTAGSGNEMLVGQGGDDTFVNGAGNDTLIGSDGSETYDINAKSGIDTIVNAPGSDSSNRVVFGAGILSADIVVSQASNGEDLLLSDAVIGQTLVLQGQIGLAGDTAPSQVSEIDFADGSSYYSSDLLNMSVQSAVASGSSTIYGDRNDNVLQGGDGDISLIGQGGNDTLIAGAGNDTLIGGGGYTTYQIASSASSYIVAAQEIDNGGPGGPGGPIGVAMVAQTVNLNSLDVDDFSSSGELDLSGIVSSNVQVTAGANGADVILTDASTGQIITIQNQLSNEVIQEVYFDDGTSWSSSDLYNMIYGSGDGGAGLPPGDYYGTNGDDSFNLTTDFTVDAGLGDDHYAVSGDGSGTFYFAKGDGHDELDQPDGATRSDTLSLTDISSDDVSLSRDADPNSDALTFTVDSTGDSFRADWQFYGDQPGSAPQGIEEIEFADGVVWDRNEIRNRSSDAVTAVAATDLSATADSDIFDVSGLSGDRSITGFDATSESHDYVQVNRSVFEDWAHLLGATQQIGSDLTIALDQNDSITLKDVALANFSSKDVKFVGSMASAGIG